MAKNITCFATGGKNVFKAAKSKEMIELQQNGIDRFTVVYGLQVKSNLNYSQAARELGAAIMHMQACEGHLDNREREEAREEGDTVARFEPIV